MTDTGARPSTEPRVRAAPTTLAVRGGAIDLAGRRILHDIDLSVDAGQFVAVLGPNGAGKSTLMRAVLGTVPLATGRLEVLGTTPARARAAVGYLPQRRSFDAAIRLRGVDVVRLGLDGARWGLPLDPTARGRARRREARARVTEAIARVGASAYAHRPIGELSGGEQQRLLIAQALVARPRLLILDEPLDSLDLPSQAGVAALVGRLARESGVTVLLVAHDVNPLLAYLDGVVYLAGGRAVAGSVSEVITTGTLSDLYGVPVDVLRAGDGRLVVVGAPEPPHHHGHRHESA
jgi:zinc/manganese transport system ATP-binding protein